MIDTHYAYQYVYDEILKEIDSVGLGNFTYLLSEKELCQKYDVSLTTVRRALEKLREEEIIIKIKGKGTIVSPKVRRIKMPYNRFIGVLYLSNEDRRKPVETKKYPEFVNPFGEKIYSAIYNALGGEYDLFLTNPNQHDFYETFHESVLQRVDKIMCIGQVDKKLIEFLQSHGKCVIVYNYFYEDVDVCRVNNDERKKFLEMTQHFIDAGYRRIACINGSNQFSEYIERYLGYQEAIIKNKLSFEMSYVKWGNMTPESGYNFAKELLSCAKRPEVIICANDGVAMGVYDALKDAGLVPGKDVVIAGHDNLEFDNEQYRFTTIDAQYDKIGKIIAQKLCRETWIDDTTIQEGKLIIR